MECWYMSGAGNDFMIVDGRGEHFNLSQTAKDLCALSGADGFMAVDESHTADFRLHFYNSDGTRGEMCGNGSRCVCRFAYEHGIVGKHMTLETDAGIVTGCRLTESQYRVKLNNPGEVDLMRKPDAAYIELGNPGVPHAVKEIPNLTWQKMTELLPEAQRLRYDPAFPKGANVNFFSRIGENEVRVLTFERGVEDYTLACGTGCSSVAVSLFLRGQLPGGHLTARTRGGTLQIYIAGTDGNVEAVYLEGPTEKIRTYEL